MHLNKNLAEDDIPAIELKSVFDYLFEDDRITVLNHWESEGSILETLEIMALNGMRWLMLDHLTLLASSSNEGGSENSHMDRLMNDLRRLVKKYEVHIDVVSQLRKVGDAGKSFESGYMPTVDDLKGSGSIKQCAWNIIGFARDMTSENDLTRNTINFSVLKCRKTGLSGPLRPSYYSYKYGRVFSDPPEEYESEKFQNYSNDIKEI
jgi:twinkle protein